MRAEKFSTHKQWQGVVVSRENYTSHVTLAMVFPRKHQPQTLQAGERLKKTLAALARQQVTAASAFRVEFGGTNTCDEVEKKENESKWIGFGRDESKLTE